MGTTQAAIRNRNPNLAYVLVIEGYKYLITNDSPSKAVTAWSGTLWSDALTGLQVEGAFKQSVEPWTQEIVVPRITFTVTPEQGNDQFGVDMFKSKPSVRSELTVGFDTGDSSGGGFNITVQDADQFSTGTVYIGNEAFNVTSAPSGTTIPVATNGEGYYNPFSTNAGASNRFPMPHNLPTTTTVNSYDTAAPVYVSDSPQSWIGKKVALYVHRIDGGVWDVQAQAELWFAGIIDNITESENGDTVLECEGIQKLIADANILEDQWIGRPKPGYKFQDGQYFDLLFTEFLSGGGISTHHAGALTCTTGASGADQFEPGYYTANEIAAVISQWLDEDSTLGQSGSGITLRWSSYISSDAVGMRFKLMAQEGASIDSSMQLIASDASMLEFLGFTDINRGEDRCSVPSSINNGGEYTKLISDDAPYHIFPLKAGNYSRDHKPPAIELETSDGSYVEHTDQLPPGAREHVVSGESWSFFSMGDDVIFLARKDSDTALSSIFTDKGIGKKAEGDPNTVAPGIRMSSDADVSSALIRQLFVVSDSLQNLITKLFASVDGNGANHATYDVFPFGAGIPWSLLGDNFTDSLANLEQASAQDSICLVVEKPTKLWEVIRCEFILRMAALVWKDGGIQCAEFTVPNAVTADFTLDETNKSDSRRTITEATSQYLVNTLKVEYNRDPLTGKYSKVAIVRDKAGYEAAGKIAKTKTIKARNSYSSLLKTGAAVEALTQMISARFLPVLSRPLKRWRRSISHREFHMSPGDTVALTDNYIRNPSTGTRGISARACTVLSVSNQFGIASGSDYLGEVDLLYTEEDRLFTLCPSLEHASVTSGNYTDGWDSSNVMLLVQKHAFTQSSGTDLDVDGFTVGDEIRVYERDPSTPGSEDYFSDEITAIAEDAVTGYDAIKLSNGFGVGGRPAFSSSKLYAVTFDDYSTVASPQQSYAYQADSGDGFILDTIEPNLMGDDKPLLGFDAETGTALPVRYSGSQYGDGQAMSACVARDVIRMANNLANYKTALHQPIIIDDTEEVVSSTGAEVYRVIRTFPLYLGRQMFTGGKRRLLNIAPQFRSGSGGTTAYCRITSSANPPSLGETVTGVSFFNVEWKGPKQQVTFSTSSATLWTHATAQTLAPVRGEHWNDITWITVEGGDLCAFKGLSELWLGPLA